jgi:hypothetical protein
MTRIDVKQKNPYHQLSQVNDMGHRYDEGKVS